MALYTETFEQYPALVFRDLVRLLSKGQQEELIKDILRGEVESIEEWLLRDKSQRSISTYSPTDLAFDLLVKSDPEWLNDHRDFFQKVFLDTLADPSVEALNILENIKILTANARAGVGLDFLMRCLREGLYRNEKEELEFYLLLAKLEEGKPEFNPGWWFKDYLQIEPSDKPHLSALRLYVYRKVDPKDAIRSLLIWDDQIIDKVLNFPDWLRNFILTYLRQAIYFQVLNKSLFSYGQYLAIKKLFHQQWLIELFEEAEMHAALKPMLEELQATVESESEIFSESADIGDVERERGLMVASISEENDTNK